MFGEKNTTHHILVIDDEIVIANVIKKMLARHGYTCDIAYNGNDGLKKFMKNEYDLILLDVHLGDISGPDLLETIFEKNPEQAVIIITASVPVEKVNYQDRFSRKIPVLSKPFSIAELAHRLSEVFSSVH